MKKIITCRFLKRNLVLVLLLTLSVSAFAQLKISGIVADAASGETLIGASVFAEGTSTGTVTDFDGTYSLTVDAADAVLIFTYTGYQTQEIKVTESKTLDVKLAAADNLLNEVVVVGYGSKKKVDLTGSIASLSAKDFEAQPITRVENALQGRTAGVQVSNTNGSPGNNARIRIRGTNSITGSGSPLVVLDGILGASLGAINPSDIESIQVLKDASATALYGSRGANGVILVTSKKGKDGSNVNLDAFFGLQSLPKKIDIVSPAEYARLVNEQLAVGGSAPAFFEEDITEFENGAGTDWQDEIYREGTEALTQNYTLSFNGKKDKIGYYVAGNLVDNEGILTNNFYKRLALRSNLDFELNDRMTAGLNITYSKEEALNGFASDLLFAPNASALIFAPVAEAFTADGTPTKFSPYGSIAVSPTASTFGRNDNRQTNNATATAFFNWKITDDITYSFTGGVRDVNATSTIAVASYATTGQTEANVFNSDFTQFQHTHVLGYSKLFGAKHDFGIKAIFEEQDSDSYGSAAFGQNLLVESVGINNIGFAETQVISSGQSAEAIRSYVGRVEYEFDDKYLFTGTVRADGSSKFPEANRFGVFPSVAAAWRLSEEGFIKDLGIFDNLKLRASYGQVGNQAISPYSSLALLQTSPTAFNPVLDNTAPVIGIAPGRAANPNLRWETTTQTDIGIDFGFMDGRLTAGFDYYTKTTSDLLLFVSTPTYTGLGAVLQNVGEIGNKGFEVDLGYLALNREDLRWDIAFNLAANKTTVLDIGNNDVIFPGRGFAGSGSLLSRVEVGGELGNFVGYINDGTWNTDEESEAAVYGLQPGDTKYRDLNEDGVINEEDVTIIGNGAPDLIWGLNNTVSYKGFELNIFLQSMMGQDVFNVQRAVMMGTSGDVKTPTHGDIRDRWTPTNQDTDTPAFSSTNFQAPEDSRFIEDASFIRLRNVRLSYTVPAVKGFKSLTVYVSGQNLLTFTDYKGYDPEVSGAGDSNVDLGIDNGTYPNPKVITFGVNAGF